MPIYVLYNISIMIIWDLLEEYRERARVANLLCLQGKQFCRVFQNKCFSCWEISRESEGKVVVFPNPMRFHILKQPTFTRHKEKQRISTRPLCYLMVLFALICSHKPLAIQTMKAIMVNVSHSQVHNHIRESFPTMSRIYPSQYPKNSKKKDHIRKKFTYPH